MDSEDVESEKLPHEQTGLTQTETTPSYEDSSKKSRHQNVNWSRIIIVVLSLLLVACLLYILISKLTEKSDSHEEGTGSNPPNRTEVRVGEFRAVNSVARASQTNTLSYKSTNWVYQSTGVFVGGSNHLLFEAKALKDAIIGLATTNSDESVQWEVVIGGSGDTVTFMRSKNGLCGDGTQQYCWTKSLDPKRYRPFWLSWDSTTIRIGTGSNVGRDEYCSYFAPVRLTDFYVRLRSYATNTVDWKIRGYSRDAKGEVIPDQSEVVSVCRNKDCGSNAYCTEQGGKAKCQCELGYTSAHQGCIADTTTGISPEVQGMVQTGLSAGELVADVIHDNKLFSETITQIAGIASPLMSAVSIVFDIAFMFLPSQESQILIEMREQFRIVNEKLEKIENEIKDLGHQITWNTYKSFFEQYALKIIVLNDKADDLAKNYDPNDRPSFDSKKTDIIHYYENSFDSDEFINFLTYNILGGFFESYGKHVKNHRSQCQDLMRIVLYYVTQASKIDMTYLRLKEVPQGRIDNEKENWCNHFKNVQTKFIEVDTNVANAWSRQAKGTDIPNFLRDNSGLSHSDFANQLLSFLSEKYYWHHWFVASYNEISTFSNHAVTGDSEFAWHWFRTHRRNLVVASVPKHVRFDSRGAKAALDKYKNQPNSASYPCCEYCRHSPGSSACSKFECCRLRSCSGVEFAKLIYDQLPGHGVMKFVVLSASGVQAVSSDRDRFVQTGGIVRCDYYSDYTAMYFG